MITSHFFSDVFFTLCAFVVMRNWILKQVAGPSWRLQHVCVARLSRASLYFIEQSSAPFLSASCCCCVPHMFSPIYLACRMPAPQTPQLPDSPFFLLLLLDPHKFSSFGTGGNSPMKIGDKASLFLPTYSKLRCDVIPPPFSDPNHKIF